MASMLIYLFLPSDFSVRTIVSGGIQVLVQRTKEQ